MNGDFNHAAIMHPLLLQKLFIIQLRQNLNSKGKKLFPDATVLLSKLCFKVLFIIFAQE